MAIKLAIEELIDLRCRELGMRPIDLIRRTTYRNEAKGFRRMSALRSGDLTSCKELIASLPRALDVSIDTFEVVMSETRRQLTELDQQQKARRKQHGAHHSALTRSFLLNGQCRSRSSLLH